MTPIQLQKARRKLGLTLSELAAVLGYRGSEARSQVHHMETGRRPIREPQRRLIEAYMAGYRPDDWPVPHEEAA